MLTRVYPRRGANLQTRNRSVRATRPRRPRPGWGRAPMADEFDPAPMIERFRERARAVRRRGVPPVEGPERRQFIEQAQLDFQDFAMLGDATATLEDGVLVLRVDLRPPAESG